jgi:hypothetical protein
MIQKAAVFKEQVTKLEWFSGACASASSIQTTISIYTPADTKGWQHAHVLVKKTLEHTEYKRMERLVSRVGGVMWSPGKNPVPAMCGVVEDIFQKDSCCNTVKCPLPFAIPGSTAFQYKVQAQAIAATLTDQCYAKSPRLNQCKTRLQTGLVDPVAQARARAIIGARR